jgi:urease accessory protein
VSDSLKVLLTEARFPSDDPTDSGGMEAAHTAGLVTGVDTLRSFLYGRLWTSGVVGAVSAAAICARARQSRSLPPLFSAVEAELDARLHSPAARATSRRQGGQLLRRARTTDDHPTFEALDQLTRTHHLEPHYPIAVGAVAAVAGASPEEAAEVAAYASVAGPAFAAQALLGLDPDVVSNLGVEMAPEVSRLAREASQISMRSLSDLPAYRAPVLEYLAEEHMSAPELRSYAS